MLVSIGTLRYLAYVIVVRCVLLQVVLGKDYLRMGRTTVYRVVRITVHWVVVISIRWARMS